jgi:predicted DsbA family dithiol-disulfide isomerase
VIIEHWFDFICPYCYLAQDRNRILRAHGIELVEHGLQIHPEIGPGGTTTGPRVGPTYDFLAQEAAAAGLPLHWTDRIGHSRPALAAFEWLRASDVEVADRFAEAVFTAYFADGHDIESEDLLAKLAATAGGDADELLGALATTAAVDLLVQSERRAAQYGVRSTPTWVAGGERLSGLQTREWFERWAAALTAPAGR